ncbi:MULTISPECIES: long-chain fatty acid--CoA ligase [unclassified Sporosarcina]|uniref:long-chain fatty acid--CoA ligase n=1 Tax=unclassified Sporosarcina TaxID=2647733 RepID=UPI000C172904|nr:MULTISPECIES: long-chain fatty acid--CoA ligase [unclassified Sporosarcina]PID07386.1 fatty-acid--CoA ligase [Sporosarcina sp. P30]PID10581.1 fatty-acid--CoA ligase [Sporosarcina sp. P31]PID13156.1 fatty-acid--CoA ligase [Sporosarcina sp. P32b]
MMQTPLILSTFITRAERFFPNKMVISRTGEQRIQRFTYREWAKRTRKLSNALTQLGMEHGTKVGTFAWNHHRHLEAYFAVPCTGAILHMINIRLSPEHIMYIINHAEDEILLVDAEFFPHLEKMAPMLKTVKHFVIMGDSKDIPETTLENVHSYEALLENASDEYDYPQDLDENTPAGLCYTSATTGLPKGVIYTHRGLVLQSYALGLSDAMGVCERDIAMSVVPMFHVNAWGIPFAGVFYGTTQVLPGPGFNPAVLLDLIESEKVTITAGVPTIWLAVLKELEQNPRDISSLRGIVCGGSASPKGLIRTFEEKYKVPFIVGYGMTETSPLVSLSVLTSSMDNLTTDERIDMRALQGLVMPGLDIRVVNENGEVPWDGETMGELTVRGPWIASEYYKDERTEEAFKDGWLYTGDIAVMTEDGYLKLTDRTKDLIKSGGEWISSVDLENALMSHDDVYEAAVIAVPHEKWMERPLACVVLNENVAEDDAKVQELKDSLKVQFASWWIPDEILFVKEIPKTSVGKFLKAALRDQLKEHYTKE